MARSLAEALTDLKSRASLVARILVKDEAAAKAAGGAAGNVRITSAGPSGVRGKWFEGVLEAWRDKKGDLVLVSERRLPGFRVYVTGDGTFREEIYAEKRWVLSRIEKEIAAVLDAGRFSKWMLKKTDWRMRRDADTGNTIFEGKVSQRVASKEASADAGHPDGSLAVGGMEGRILRIEAKLILSPKNRFERIVLKLVRNDLMAEIIRASRRGGGFVVRGPGAPVPPNPKAKDKPIEGKTTTYTIEYRESRASDDARAFRERMRKHIAAREARGE